MNLNKRVGLLILPVVVIGYLIALLGVYNSQKETLIELEQRSLDLQVTELKALFSSYESTSNSFIESLLYSNSLHNYLLAKDKMFQALSLEKGLENAIKDLNELKSDYMSVGLVSSLGNVEYYFENSSDPFASMTPEQQATISNAFENHKHEVAKLVYNQDKTYITLVRIIDKLTFKEPIDYDSSSGLAIFVAVEPTSFDKKIQDLKKRGLIFAFHEGDNFVWPETHNGIVSIRDLGMNVSFSLMMPEHLLTEKLQRVKYTLLVSFIVVAVPTYILLMLLIRRYVTGPIKHLKDQISEIDFESGRSFEPSDAHDEIGNVSRTFGKLYEKLEQSYRLTKDLAEKDSLTKLYNRRIFNMLVEKAIQRSKHNNKTAALFYLDIDNFKFVNDTYGHGTGDALLMAFSERLKGVLRAGDQVINCPLNDSGTARLAGDEFAVILCDLPTDEQAHWLAQRMLDICKNGFALNTGVFPISLSIGVALYPLDGLTTEELITNADAAMYEAKMAGKNRYSFYSVSLAEKSRRVNAVELALKNLNYSELMLYYMPIVSAEDQSKTQAIEGLIRWNSAKLGMVFPDEFIPIAESTGYYERIDAWVIEQAFADSARIKKKFGDDVRININISAAQLTSKVFVTMLTQLIKQYAIDPKNFEFEITETFSRGKSERENSLLFELKRLGFNLALDDFGTGYTSIMQLVDYPVDTIKIDREFTALLNSPEKRNKAISMIRFCVLQGFKVTVEGIETAQMLALLEGSGCYAYQGYLFAKPMPLESLLQLGAKPVHSSINDCAQ